MQILVSLTMIAGVLFGPPAKEQFYLDPGSGSFLVQLAIATVLGGLFVIKGYWQRIVGFFRKRGGENQEDDQEK